MNCPACNCTNIRDGYPAHLGRWLCVECNWSWRKKPKLLRCGLCGSSTLDSYCFRVPHPTAATYRCADCLTAAELEALSSQVLHLAEVLANRKHASPKPHPRHH